MSSSSDQLLPVIFVNPELVTRIRGSSRWVNVFYFIATATSLGFAGFVYLGASEEPMGRSIQAFIAILFCFSLVLLMHAWLNAYGFISKSLAVQFFLRGAVFSILIALVLEIFESWEITPDFRSKFWVFPLAFTAGFAEEVGKLSMVLAGLCLVPNRLPAIDSSCAYKWIMLIESPRGLAFAGFAVGLGFMTSENLVYWGSVFEFLPISFRGMVVFMRTFLNLHPYLTGLSAARLAVWDDRKLSLGKVVSAIWPSVLIHALYDFGLMLPMSDPENRALLATMMLISLALIPTIIVLFVLAYRRLPVVEPRVITNV